MTAQKYGVAIIGCGDMGAKHAAAWAAQGMDVIAVCDADDGRAAALARTHKAQVHSHWEDAVAQDGVDIVSVCVPACFHRDITVVAANAGRHILCEKPMALTLDEADDMIAAAKANDVHLSICHQYRALSRFTTMKRLLDAGRIGYPYYIRFTEMREVRPKLAMHIKPLSGGPLHDMTGHLFDLGRFLTEREAVSVSATGTVFAKGKDRMKPVTDFGIDTAEILVRFEGGHSLSICLNWGLPEGTPGHCHDLVHGPLGMLYSQDAGLPNRFLGDLSHTLSIALKSSDGTTRIDCPRDRDGPVACIEDLVSTIQDDTPSQFSAENGRAALHLILASLEAIETGETVVLRP